MELARVIKAGTCNEDSPAASYGVSKENRLMMRNHGFSNLILKR